MARYEVWRRTKGYLYDVLSDEKADEIIKVLSQEAKIDVLDKIAEEIEEVVLESLSDDGDDWFAARKVNACLDIIDKYKAESEE